MWRDRFSAGERTHRFEYRAYPRIYARRPTLPAPTIGRDRWQAADYSDFRVNYATHMLNPSIEVEEQEGTGPAPTVPISSNADAPATAATATVEGVLVVAASPAPAPLTSRQVNVNQSTARHGGGGGDAAPSQDRVSKSSRHEKVREDPGWGRGAGPEFFFILLS